MSSKQIIIGARGSALSVKQAEEVIISLKKLYPAIKFTLKIITTKGDRLKNALPREKGIFVKEIEQALIKKHIDVAVHSLKDLPTKLPPGLTIGAITKRNTPYDVLITKSGKSLEQLNKGALLGTSSLRRKAQINIIRDDLTIVDIRGNVDTRLRKLRQGKFDGIVCALCAIERLKIKDIKMKKLSLRSFLPAPGQGALAIEIRENDRYIKEIVEKINHKKTALCVTAERDFLNYLKGGCRLPVGAYATVNKNKINLRGMVAKPDGSSVIRVQEEMPLKDAGRIGKILACKALKLGAGKILEEL